MQNIDIIAVGKMRDKSQLALWADYTKRITSRMTLHELSESDNKDALEKAIMDKLDHSSFKIILDERGKSVDSVKFAKIIQNKANQGISRLQFVIGGADGHSDAIRNNADYLLSFGAQTWPHMLARIMLAEQIYRTQQILNGHPYHRA